MKNILKLVITPLVSLFIFVLGSGLFTTLLAVRLHNEGSSTIYIGAMTGVYYAGLAVGSFNIEKYIIRVGHIRSFAAFAATICALSLLQGLYLNHIVWIILRFLGGVATAGVLIVFESWLLSVGHTKVRGQILALYMVSYYAAQALGQFFINYWDPNSLDLFAITALLTAVSIIPLSLSIIPPPAIHEPSSLNFKKLFDASASGIIGSLSSGLIIGSLYGLLPLVVMQLTGSKAHVALYVALLIFGGMFLQYPVGRLSDYIERRLILVWLSILTAVIAIIMMLPYPALPSSYVLTFILGGITFTLYPVSVSHASDSLEQGDIVSGTQGLLLAYSIGAAIGPFIAPYFMEFVGSSGLYLFIVCVSVPLTIFLVWRKANVAATPQEDQFVVMPQTTPIVAELDPRGETNCSGDD